MIYPQRGTEESVLIIPLWEDPSGQIFTTLVKAVNQSDGLLRIPGGGVNQGEAASMAAPRELLEETGLHAESLYFIKTFSKKSWRPSSKHHQHVFITEVKNINTLREISVDGEEVLHASIFLVNTISEYFEKKHDHLHGCQILKPHAEILSETLKTLGLMHR